MSAASTTFHTYSIDWTKDRLQWLIDGVVVRTLEYSAAAGGKEYPQSPMQVRIGNWIGGNPSNAQGTINWAGGLSDMSKGPFNMYVESVSITNYSPAAAYQYGDTSGTYQSIKLLSSSNTPTSSSALSSLPSSSKHASSFSTVIRSSSTNAAQPNSSAVSSATASIPSSSTMSPDGSCGGSNLYTCQIGSCCSQYNFCGSTDEFCGTGCQSAFGSCGSAPISSSKPIVNGPPAPSSTPVPAKPAPAKPVPQPPAPAKQPLNPVVQKICNSILARLLPMLC
jgi:hypothetical protein